MKRNHRIILLVVVSSVAILLLLPRGETVDPYSAATTSAPEFSGPNTNVPGPAAANGVRFIRHSEPSLQAFSLEVPEDWQVQSGVTKQGNAEATWFRMRSPDGRTEMRIGDPRLPGYYMEPGPTTQQLGLSEGNMLSDGGQVRSYVDPITQAAEYAERMARESGCSGIEVTRRISAQEVVAEMTPQERGRFEAEVAEQRALMARYTPEAQLEVQPGGVDFQCTGGERIAGKIAFLGMRMQFANRFGGPPTLGWGGTPIGFIAPVESMEFAEAVMDHLGSTLTTSEHFKARQEAGMAQAQQQMRQDNARTDDELARINAETNRIIQQGYADRARINSETNAYIGHLQREGFENRMRSQDEGMRRWSNAMMGTTDIYDAQTGTTHYGVQSGYDSYWVDPATNNVVGTPQDYRNPDPLRYNPTQNLDDRYNSGGW